MADNGEVNLQDVLRRLQALEDEREILRTLNRYGHTIDYGLEAEWVDLFTEDGVRVYNGGEGRHTGRGELRQYIPRHTRAPEKYHKHLTAAPVITLDGDEARVESYWARIDDRESGPFILGYGRYLDHLVRCSDGKWRFKERWIEREALVKGEVTWRTP